MTTLFSSLAFAICSVLFYQNTGQAKEHRQHGAHVHGSAYMSIAIEKNQVAMDFDVPGIDLVGFEHKAKTAHDKKTLSNRLDYLRKHADPLQFPADSICRITSRRVDPEQHAGEDHIDYELGVKYQCADTSKIDQFSTSLFKENKSLKFIKVDVITVLGQTSQTLTDKDNIMVLDKSVRPPLPKTIETPKNP